LTIPVIAEGFYNVKDHICREISIYGAEKNDIFLVKEFAGSIHNVQKKNEALERAAKIIAENGYHWIKASDLQAITHLLTGKSQVLSECKELIVKRKV